MEPEGGGGGGGIGAVRRDPRMEARAAARDVVLALAPAGDTGVSAGGDGRADVGTAVTVDEEAEEDEELEWYSQGCANEFGGAGAGGVGSCRRPSREPEEDEEADSGPAEVAGCGEVGAEAETGAD